MQCKEGLKWVLRKGILGKRSRKQSRSWTSSARVWQGGLWSGGIPKTALAIQKKSLPNVDEKVILTNYKSHLKRQCELHLGYPYNFDYKNSELSDFMGYSINNLGDPFVTSNYGVHSREFECAVIAYFAEIWELEWPAYWGYVTTCGTEGNLHAMLMAREAFPDGILYTSKETHYSIFKAARYFRMKLEEIPTLPAGQIDLSALGRALAANRGVPAIINVNVGTTVKGAVDDLDAVVRQLAVNGYTRDRFYIHCDGALFGMMMPFVQGHSMEVSFRKPIDSIAVSGHKFIGCSMPCGVVLTRKEHVVRIEEDVEYLNSKDTTIMGSRNGQAALHLWYSLRKKTAATLRRDVQHCMKMAAYLVEALTQQGFVARLNRMSCTVVLERPMDDGFVHRWQLACERDIAHVVVMPSVDETKIQQFLLELLRSAATHGRRTPDGPDSPLQQMTSAKWA